MLQKSNIRKVILVTAISIPIAGLVFLTLQNSCDIQHVAILTDIGKYEQTLDPDLCHSLLERIDSHNARCEIHLEVLDCG